MTQKFKTRSKQYFTIGILISLLLHLWLLLAFIHIKTKKPKKNKPIEINLVQKGIPQNRILPKAIPVPPMPQAHPSPRPKVYKPYVSQRPTEHPKQAQRPRKYATLPSHILKSLPKSTYKPVQESYSAKSRVQHPSASSKETPPIGEKQHNAKANLNLNIKQFVKKEESVYQYLSWLIRYLNKQAQERDLYPKEAKRLGIKGEVVVRVTINKDGTIDRSSLRVVQSSGYRILDESAPKIIYELSPFRKPPKKITINLPVYFLINGYY